MDITPLLQKIKGGLIVSCQALLNEPMHGAGLMVAMARSAVLGGAVGIRSNGPDDIAAIRAEVNLPLIGLYKVEFPGFEVYITPTVEQARQVAQAGADIIALDATQRPHPDRLGIRERIWLVHQETDHPVMADIATLEEGLLAEDAGADLVATTLSGYTADSPKSNGPDFELLQHLVERLEVPVIAEGRIATPEQARCAIDTGAFAIVVGSAITRPQWITQQFVRRIQSVK